jgi:hypothetical protein
MYERQAVSRKKRTKPSSKKSYVHGRWSEIPERDRERLGNLVQAKAAELRSAGSAILRAKAFEYLCVEMAVGLGRRITETEQAHLVGTADLPDQTVRAAFRAQELGGPTTEGEPSFTDYYRLHFGKEPPEHLREDLPPTAPETFVTASDGKEVKADTLEAYEDYLRTQREARLRREEAGREAGFVGLDEEGE